MKKIYKILVFTLLIPLFSIGQTKQDSLNEIIQNDILSIKKDNLIIDSLKTELSRLNSRHEYQLKINEQTLNSISNQIGATSFNLSFFGILFAIAALGLGVYVTYIE